MTMTFDIRTTVHK